MNLERRVKKLNDLLRQELGGDRPFAWKWSESPELIHRMRARSADGSVKMEPKATPSGLIVMQPVYVSRKICLFAECQWLICRNLPPEMTEDQWLASIGTGVPYPQNGTWAPLSQFTLERGAEPDEPHTWKVIELIRAQRALHQKSEDNEEEYQQEKAREQRKNDIYLHIRDIAPAFNGIPGKKEHFSFGGVGNNLIEKESA
jgi:hypothetical protein